MFRGLLSFWLEEATCPVWLFFSVQKGKLDSLHKLSRASELPFAKSHQPHLSHRPTLHVIRIQDRKWESQGSFPTLSSIWCICIWWHKWLKMRRKMEKRRKKRMKWFVLCTSSICIAGNVLVRSKSPLKDAKVTHLIIIFSCSLP